MHRFRLVSAIILLFAAVLFAVALAPARLLAWVLPASQLSATGFSGTVWKGQVASMRVATPVGPLQLGGVHWEVAPASLFALAPTLRWQSQWGSQQLQGRARWLGGQSLELADLEFGVDAGVLRRLLPLTVSGRFSGLLPAVVIDEGRLASLRGQVTWRDAVWRDGDSRFALGSYAVEFTPGADGAAVGNVITLQGPLSAAGNLTLSRAGAFALALTFDSEQPLAPPLERALLLMAVPQNGGFRLQLQGNLYPTPR